MASAIAAPFFTHESIVLNSEHHSPSYGVGVASSLRIRRDGRAYDSGRSLYTQGSKSGVSVDPSDDLLPFHANVFTCFYLGQYGLRLC